MDRSTPRSPSTRSKVQRRSNDALLFRYAASRSALPLRAREVPSSCLQQVAPEKSRHAPHRIKLGQSLEDVSLIWVDLDLVRNFVLLQDPLQFMGPFHRDNVVKRAVKDQNRRQVRRVRNKVLR